MFYKTIQLQFERIKNNKTTFILLLALAATVILFGNKHDAGNDHKNLLHAFAYLLAMYLCSLVIDLFATIKPFKGEFPVRRPLLESFIVFVFPILGAITILARFTGNTPWDTAPAGYKILIALGVMLFVYPIALVITLFIMGYRRKDFGVRLQGFVPSVIVIVITAATAAIVAPHGFTLQAVIKEGGGVGVALLMGFVYAGLSEEIFRLVMQTRFKVLLNNTGLAWFIASLVWGLLHGPKWYSDNRDITETVLSCLRIVPLGLMWGYLTHRTKSILPSVLAHGLNVWGLQNF